MPLAPITDVTQVTVSGALAGGENWANVLNFRRMSGQAFDGPHAEALGSAIRSAYASLAPFWPSTTVLQQFTFRNLAIPGSSPIITTTVPLPGSGTPADALPNDIAHVVTLHSGEGGRRGRGRIFVPAFTKAAINSTAGGGPQLVAGALSALEDFGSALGTYSNPPDTRLVVVSRVDNLSRLVIGGYVDSKCDTMRRRDNRQSGITRLALTPSFPAP
jgi:hypothetical protein